MINYISIDIETTGLDPSKHQILEVGAVYDNGASFLDLPRFECLIVHEDYNFQLMAAKMNAGLIEELCIAEAELPNGEYRRYSGDKWICTASFFSTTWQQWLDTIGIKWDKFNIAGKNVAMFDLPFLEKLTKINNRRRIIDPAILYLEPEDTKLPNLSVCCERAGLGDVVAHRALGDAEMVVKLLRRVL